MAESSNWTFPQNLQPDAESLAYDLDAALDSVVMLRAEIPEDAFTAQTLGTERIGNGVVIREDGLILTIGYLITEAESIWLSTNSGVVVPGHPLAYDAATGFGLVLPLGRLGAPMLPRGSANSVSVDDDVTVIGHGRRMHSLKATIVAKREFVGYWEYLLDEALFTAPAHPQWGCTSLVNERGQFVGHGSLLVQEAREEGKQLQGNMFVPVDLLEPILDEMLKFGRRSAPPRPWLGMYAVDVDGHVAVSGLADGGPAARAGLRKGDLLMEVGGVKVKNVADLFRKVWATGPAGTDIPFLVGRKGAAIKIAVRSADRNDLMKKPQLH